MKNVQETAAGKSISAWVILNRKREFVATVRAHYGNSGRVLVNIWDNKAGFQSASAGGYGYDKLGAALAGLSVDGHKLSDHCSRDGAPKPPRGRVTYPQDYKPPRGYHLANWADGSKRYDDGSKRYPRIPDNEAGFTDCYREQGFRYLQALGYHVIRAI